MLFKFIVMGEIIHLQTLIITNKNQCFRINLFINCLPIDQTRKLLVESIQKLINLLHIVVLNSQTEAQKKITPDKNILMFIQK